MASEIAGFPHWEVHFDEAGRLAGTGADALVAGTSAEAITDLFISSHGWNNDADQARRLYRRLFTAVRAVLDDLPAERRPTGRIGVAGVIWPAKSWADDQDDEGGAASAVASPTDRELVMDLVEVFPEPSQAEALEQMALLLEERPGDEAELRRFHALMTRITTSGDDDAEDGDAALLERDPLELFDELGAGALPAPDLLIFGEDPEGGGATGLGDRFRRQWSGAKEALRAATYWQMKKRAGTVGSQGLGPLVARLRDTSPELRVHLVGHSFGARLVSYALRGLPAATLRPTSPVKSLVMLQGAFSHFAFADSLPHDRGRSGALKDMDRRVDGPIVVTHSLLDTALTSLYPKASLVAREDAAALENRLYRWSGMGHDGAQAVGAAASEAGPVGAAYSLAPGGFLNLDCNRVIRNGGGPSGAHSDIVHPELAWAMLLAAGLARSG